MKIFSGIKKAIGEITGYWKQISPVRVVYFSQISLILTILIELMVITLMWRKFPQAVPLWISLPWGAERLASPIWLLVLPITAFVWFAINLTIATYLTAEHPIFTRILFLTSTLVNIMSLFVIVNIVLLIT